MEQAFISSISINNVRHLHDITIPLSETEPKHLILTGKNGSGKTSVLMTLKTWLQDAIQNNNFNRVNTLKNDIENTQKNLEWLNQQLRASMDEGQRMNYRQQITSNQQNAKYFKDELSKISQLTLQYQGWEYIQSLYKEGQYIIAYFDAKRLNQMNTPTGINKVEIRDVYGIEEKASSAFIQYIVNLKADRSFARDDNDTKTIEEIDRWFEKFEGSLRTIFGDDTLRLEFDKKNYNFNFIQQGRNPFTLSTLSDGYSSIISILSELILRMENRSSKSYELQGLVLIDEAETHLHIELQKTILPFLTQFFPKLQFIITSHSPFVLTSIDNAVIYDLENQFRMEDLSAYSVDGVIEGYFNVDKYSKELKGLVNEYEQLLKAGVDANAERKSSLREYFKNSPKFLAPELDLKIKELELQYFLGL